MFLFISAAILASTAATPDADWSRVRHLKHSTEVIVTLQNGSRPGPYSDVTRVVAATDEELIVAPLGPRAPVIRIPRDDIASVTIRSEKTRGSAAERARGVLVGLLFGLIGAANGGTGPTLCDKTVPGCIAYIGAGGVAGGVIGYLEGKSERIIELTLIYRAPRV